MVTKESLQAAQAAINEATLKIKQSYSNSPTAKQLFFIVEGKDDVPYYGIKGENYIPDDWKIVLVPARNRKKVVETYQAVDWETYSKARIFFFLDRDLSDYTGEYTPSDSNVYVTAKYAIENELCTVDTYIKTLKYYCNLLDIDETDEKALEEFYSSCWSAFSEIAEPIMAQLLFWKSNSIKSNYSNYKMQNAIEIKHNLLQLNPRLQSEEDILQDLFSQSNIEYTPVDISYYKDLLKAKHTPDEYIRGKFVLAFFVKLFNYTIQNSSKIIPSCKEAKDTIGLGYENAVAKLCGIAKAPDSLKAFFNNIRTELTNTA